MQKPPNDLSRREVMVEIESEEQKARDEKSVKEKRRKHVQKKDKSNKNAEVELKWRRYRQRYTAGPIGLLQNPHTSQDGGDKGLQPAIFLDKTGKNTDIDWTEPEDQRPPCIFPPLSNLLIKRT
ncbi:Hypothetical predicted protein [Scomber scombrus]|uniref:Uncharacterized protein n=1 Tax=Scomber scombrus TaxID=13677 RepID=A0AAV1PV37_SCOSC